MSKLPIKAWMGLSGGEVDFSRQPDMYRSGSAVVAEIYKHRSEAKERCGEVIQVELRPVEELDVTFKKPLTINELFIVDLERARRWHDEEDWSALEWAGAMCGEAGEAANAAKKLKRVHAEIKNINEGDRSLTTVEAASRKVAAEAADTIIYALLLMARVGVTDPENVIREVFNKKSEEYGFPERL